MLPLQTIDRNWTLFLDRDGVINHEKPMDYIHTWGEFKFYDGVQEAMRIFAKIFPRIIIVTNQKGVGKGITKLENLEVIHSNMKAEIVAGGGRIDAIYFCSDLDDNSPNRKPQTGMGKQAIEQYPDIKIENSIMVGNTMSDMQFGRNLGVFTVFLPTTRHEVALDDGRIDAVYPSLIAFARALSGR